MSIDDFRTSSSSEHDSDGSVDSNRTNLRTEKLDSPESLDTPEYVSLWVSDDEMMAMMEVTPSYFREHVSEEIKDRAKEKGLIHLDKLGPEPVIVLTDDPEEYGLLLETFGLEDFLLKRCEEAI